MPEETLDLSKLSKKDAVALMEQLKKITKKGRKEKRKNSEAVPVDKENINLSKKEFVEKQRAASEKKARMKEYERALDGDNVTGSGKDPIAQPAEITPAAKDEKKNGRGRPHKIL